MTDAPTPAPDPPPTDRPTAENAAGTAGAPAGGAMRWTRVVIVLALCGGLLWFGYYTVGTLADGMAVYDDAAPRAETRALEPGDAPAGGGDLLSADSADTALGDQYTPIDHDPARLPPYPGAQRQTCQRIEGGRVYEDEYAHYVLQGDTSAAQVVDHYRRAAEAAGFTPAAAAPAAREDGVVQAQFQRGEELFVVTAKPQPPGPARPPPALPPSPSVSILVQFRYPIPAAP